MTSDRDDRIKELLAQLLDMPATQRAGVLELACAGDADLMSEVESLARAYEEGSDFFAPRHTPEEFADSPAVGSRIGRYHLVKQLGEGGFGTVFLAEQQHPVRRRVALKLIKLGMDTKRVIARFNAERQALALMDHPHIARVYDAGASDTGRPYFVMELVEGVPITKFCDENKLTIRQRLQLFMQVCQAVQHAHTKGIIHRDLKPTNILVSQQDGVPVPKVIDFGIAKATQGRLTEQSFSTDQQHWLGTPQYMSPEQADGSADIDTRTDVYSLGVILYELLCGATPFDFKNASYSEIQRIIREIDPPLPSSKTDKRGLKGDLDRIVLKAMEKDRTRRYETASALAAEIRRYLNNEPVLAQPPSSGYLAHRFIRRHRVGVLASAGVVSTLMLGIAGLAIGLLRATAEARKSQAVSELAIQLGWSDKRQRPTNAPLEGLLLALNDSRKALGASHPFTQQVTFAYAEKLGQVGRSEAALALLDDNLSRVRAERPGDKLLIANALIQRGQLKVGLHQNDGLSVVLEGLRLVSQYGHLFDFDTLDLLRGTLLRQLGSWDHRPNNGLSAQIYCAVDEMFRDSSPQELFNLSDASGADVTYRLRSRCGTKDAAQGTLAGLAQDGGRIEPGLYLLAVEVKARAAPVLRRAQWVLFAPWEVTHYYVSGYVEGHIPRYGERWPPMIESRRPLDRQKVDCLAFMSSLAASLAPNKAEIGIVARTRVRLPEGRYRIRVNDGLPLYVDHERVINTWAPQAPRSDSAVVFLKSGDHEMKVEYYQPGGPYKLWVGIEPLDEGARELVAAMGGQKLGTWERGVEQPEQSDYADFADRGALDRPGR